MVYGAKSQKSLLLTDSNNDGEETVYTVTINNNFPLNVMYWAKCGEDRYEVIDGQQRITSLIRYLKNEYALNGLQELNELNGKYYKDLPKDIQKKLKSSSLSTISLLKQSTDLKYEIFARLNQGAVKLNPQELRNCIYRGSFNKMLDDIAANNSHLKNLFHKMQHEFLLLQLLLFLFVQFLLFLL